jgi:hypothetical protein
MSSFVGSLRIAATEDVVEAVFDVSERDIAVSTGGERLGSWSLNEIDLDDTGTEIYLSLGGEEVIVNMANRDSFVNAIRPPKKTKARHTRRRRDPTERTRIRPGRVLESVRRLLDRETWRGWLSDRLVRWVIASAVVIIVALLALFATASFGMTLVLIGMVALIVAALAVSEDLSAFSWIPGDISETTIVIVGAIAMLVGGLLIVLG